MKGKTLESELTRRHFIKKSAGAVIATSVLGTLDVKEVEQPTSATTGSGSQRG